MIDKIGLVRNPLTIIAAFAGIAEVSGTIVLPFISETNQGSYIWFLMLFPTLLVVLFFAILHWNHHVLYAPSDFKDEGNYFRPRPATHAESLIKEFEEEASAAIAVRAEAAEDDATINQTDNGAALQSTERATGDAPESIPPTEIEAAHVNLPSPELLSQHAVSQIIIRRLQSHYGAWFQPEVTIGGGGQNYVLDYASETKLKFVGVHFFYAPLDMRNLRRTVLRIDAAYEHLSLEYREKFVMVFIFVMHPAVVEMQLVKNSLKEYLFARYKIETRFFTRTGVEYEVAFR